MKMEKSSLLKSYYLEMVFQRDKEINKKKKLLIKTIFETLGRRQGFAMDMEE